MQLFEVSTTSNGALLPAWANAVYLLGTDDATAAAAGSGDVSPSSTSRPSTSSKRPAKAQPEGQILRGPYVQHAYRYGWRHWYREAPDASWVERDADAGA